MLITFDADYGELVFLRKEPVPVGILYLRFIPTSALHPAEIVQYVLSDKRVTIEGNFVVIGLQRIRIRPL